MIQKIAKTEIEKKRVPTLEEIVACNKKIIQSDLKNNIAQAEQGNCPDSMFSLAKLLVESHHPTNIIAALLSDRYGKLTDLSQYKPVTDLFDKKERAPRQRVARPRTKPVAKKEVEPKASSKKSKKSKANTSRFKTLGK